MKDEIFYIYIIVLTPFCPIEYVTQCFYDGDMNPVCDWARSQTRTGRDDYI